MTDITELAQREKFEAWLEGAEDLPWGYLKKRRTSDDAYKDLNTSDMWAAWKAAGAELVEALEKAQDSGKVFQQSFFRQSLMYDVVAEAYEEAKEQIAKDVEIKARLCRESNSLFDRLRVAEKRIAELESRTVTVKLPCSLDFDCELESGDYDIDEEPYLRGKVDGFNYALTKVRRLNGTAGIKWEVE